MCAAVAEPAGCPMSLRSRRLAGGRSWLALRCGSGLAGLKLDVAPEVTLVSELIHVVYDGSLAHRYTSRRLPSHHARLLAASPARRHTAHTDGHRPPLQAHPVVVAAAGALLQTASRALCAPVLCWRLAPSAMPPAPLPAPPLKGVDIWEDLSDGVTQYEAQNWVAVGADVAGLIKLLGADML